MIIREEIVSGVYSAEYILSRFCHAHETVLFTKLGADNIAIIEDSARTDNDPIVVLDVAHKVPLWKQSMEMQMGRMPQTHQMQREVRRVRWFDTKELHGNMRFKVYRRVD